ncbi:prepilin peptidase [Blastococcus sp. TF02A_35]|uniref:prepilin peptidase n=1 Tax=Blastococcus sp. TF02A-35 TaxID=2559612 RepID=UPI00107446C5|nr:prepilin peptidase [Blastococcus sp. TF02A_35]TFV50403.1 peptidase A24 [Blastococcus sp. TF02A_35]
MDVSRPVLAAVAVLLGVATGPWLSRTAARLATRGAPTRTSPVRDAVVTALTAGLLCAAALLGGPRPVTAGLLWVAAAAVVLGAVDLAAHRLPDRVLLPAAGVFAAALLVDAAVLGTWWALARAVLAGAAAFVVGAGVAAVSPAALGFGDVKLLGLLGLVLGWFGWGVLMAGVLLGLIAGAGASVLLVAAGRATWRSTVPFGPPLLAGAALALAIGGVPPVP